MGGTPDIGGVRRDFMFILFYLHPPEALPIEGELSEGLRGSFLLNHNFNFVLVVHVRHSQTSLPLLSLNHNFLTINDIHTLGRVDNATTHEIVDGC